MRTHPVMIGVITVGLLAGATGTAWADQDAVVGRLTMDKERYCSSTDSLMLMTYTLENQTNEIWTYDNPAQRTFHYEIFNLSLGGAQVAQGNLQDPGTQYVAPGQSDAFAFLRRPVAGLGPIGSIYRIFVYAPAFKGVGSGVVKNPGAGTIFEVNSNACGRLLSLTPSGSAAGSSDPSATTAGEAAALR